MPERPKRRKNNKNKRKNKNNSSSKNTDDSNKIDSSEPCSSCNNNEDDSIENKDKVNVTSAVVELSKSPPEIQNDPGTSCEQLELNEDLNNNNSDLQVVNTALLAIETFKTSDIIKPSAYVVEVPEQSFKNKVKLSNTVKSKSLDNDEDTKIVEITDDNANLSIDISSVDMVDSNNVIITDAESDVEWEKTDDFNTEKPVAQEVTSDLLSITTIPLNVAQCDQTTCLTLDEEKSLRNYLNTLNLSTQPENLSSVEIKTEIEQVINHEIKQRLRKKALAEDFVMHRLGPSRMLDVIDEEGSSESSMTSRRQSYLSEKKSDVEDLDDDVFEEKTKLSKQSILRETNSSTQTHPRSFGRLVPQECVLVGTKIKEPEISEARGNWTMQTVEKMTGAEIVYLTDTSSSSSSLHEIGEDDDGVETDGSIRMITPTIEVTDTENFLKKSFISNSNEVPSTISEPGNDLGKISKQHNDHASENVTRTTEIDMNTDKELKTNIDLANPNSGEKCEHIINIDIEYEKDSKISDKNIINTKDKSNISEIAHKSDEDKLKDSDNNKYKNGSNNQNDSVMSNIEQELLLKIEAAQTSHEIVVLSTDDIKTNLYVKDICEQDKKQKDGNASQDSKSSCTPTHTITMNQNQYDLETKVIKCEFNDAINNLIKEVSSDSETANENIKDTFIRQDSSSSVCSSQCTAKYNPNYSSLNDVSNEHDQMSDNNKFNTEQVSSITSHVKDVFECVAGLDQTKKRIGSVTKDSLKLKDLCVKKIASLPYGDKILEELASVSQRLQNITILGNNIDSTSNTTNKKLEKTHTMPHFSSPNISDTKKISVAIKVKDPIPPPVQPRHSSLKKSQEDDHRAGLPTKYVCLSPSQKMLMEKTNTVIRKEDSSHLVDMHNKFVDQREKSELYKNQKQKDESDTDSPLAVPFKSQTGSRLLALIRDPNLTRNITSLNQRLNHSLDGLQKNYSIKDKVSKPYNERLNTMRDSSFKPIPPPRPKKITTSFYESDENSEFTDNSTRSMKSERKYFHYSTGNLNKEIENDISSIQNMHRFYTNTRNQTSDYDCPRRPSLPQDLCEQQMEYIRKKEKEVEAEIERLESLKNKTNTVRKKGPRAPLISENETKEVRNDSHNKNMSYKRDFSGNSQGFSSIKDNGESGRLTSLFSSSQEEILREKMYSEYITQMAERQERKQHKIIKITNAPDPHDSKTFSKSMSALDFLDSKVNNRIEKEFISKARERWDKLGIKDPETEDERECVGKVYKEPKVIEHKIKVIEGGEEKDVKKLPSHLQEFVRFTAKNADQGAGSAGESKPGPASPHLVIMCAVIIIVLAVGKFFLRLLRYK